MKNNIEILAPVGSWEMLETAIQSKADSVYFGIENLNMRSRSSSNFTKSDLSKIVRLCKENNIKTYVTVNTIVYNEELKDMKYLIAFLSQSGIDAVIASDFSVISECINCGIYVHASTQLNISNIESVRFFSKFTDAIVLARELNLKQIKKITEQIKEENICGPSGKLIKIEIFIHGALCMAISGKCYLSLDNYNYSANRGACLQVCRKGYSVKDKEKELELLIENEYIMSPKDLKTIDFLDKIVNSGVSILKIEGRARSPEYVKTVVSTYKEALNCIYTNNFNETNKKLWNNSLESVFNRGFWNGYYLGQKLGEWATVGGSQSSKTKEYIGKISNFFSNLEVMEVFIESGNLSIGDELLIIGPKTGVIEITISNIRIDNIIVSQAKKGDICSILINDFARRNDKIYKLTPNLY